MNRHHLWGAAAALLLAAAPLHAASVCQETVNSTGLTSGQINDFTEHSYNADSTVYGAFADCTVTRTFAGPIRSLKVTIVSGQADDIGFIGSTQVTSIPVPCNGVGAVLAPVDVTNQVAVTGNRATFLLRAQDLCCCMVGWGNLPDRLPARLHWEVTLGGEPNGAQASIVGSGGEATLSVGQCVTLNLRVRFAGYPGYVDLTTDPNTTFLTDPTRGNISGNVFCARSGDAGKTFPVYGRYRDPKTGISATSTVIIHVRP